MEAGPRLLGLGVLPLLDAAVGAVSSASEEISDAAYGAFEVLHSAVDAAAEVVSSPKAGEDPIALATAGFRAALRTAGAALDMLPAGSSHTLQVTE